MTLRSWSAPIRCAATGWKMRSACSRKSCGGWGALILQCAEANRVEAGGALAVDRYGFSGMVTEKIRSHPNITVVEGEVTETRRGRSSSRPGR